jgi:HD-like signal output (HDOD) protein
MTSAPQQNVENSTEYGLIVLQAQDPPKVLMTYLRLILNYQYGLEVLVANNLQEASSLLVDRGPQIRCLFLIQDQEFKTRNPITLLGRRGTIPLFLVLPAPLAEKYGALARSTHNLFICAWNKALTQEETALQPTMAKAFEEQGLGEIPVDSEDIPYEELQDRIERRLKHLDTFPTLPEVVLRITNLINAPGTKIEELEEVLIGDPAIVHKLIQVVHSPIFAGLAHKGEWTMKEAIVRLGFKQVGAIAQQIKLINSLIKPQDSPFDMRRFWEHSVGCALIADKIYKDKLIPLQAEVAFDQYWLGALLHDIGRLVLGFFFWDYFESVQKRMLRSNKVSFRRAETRLGDVVNHEYLGRLLMLNARAEPDLVEAVGNHHNTGGRPSPLICLIHLADNFCKHLGLGYHPEEQEVYSAAVLNTLQLDQAKLENIKTSLGEATISEIKELVNRCVQH